MIIVNTVYFNETQTAQFDPADTSQADLYLTNDRKNKIDIMAMTHNVRF